METMSTVGLDLAKSVFQVHALAADGAVLVRRTFHRTQVLAFFGRLAPCRVGLEACGGVHAWARAIAALGHGDAAGLCQALRQAPQDRRRRC
jgi:transposase